MNYIETVKGIITDVKELLFEPEEFLIRGGYIPNGRGNYLEGSVEIGSNGIVLGKVGRPEGPRHPVLGKINLGNRIWMDIIEINPPPLLPVLHQMEKEGGSRNIEGAYTGRWSYIGWDAIPKRKRPDNGGMVRIIISEKQGAKLPLHIYYEAEVVIEVTR
jgi:hypothetical protein